MNPQAEIESIQQVKYHYFRAVDLKQFDKLREILTEDCTARYDNGTFAFDGREAIIKFLREALPVSNVSLHQGHHPEIELKSANEAVGTWYFHDIVYYPKEKLRLEGTGFYSDRYRKVDREWKIAHTGYRRNFEVVVPLGEVKSWRNGVEEGLFAEA
jgi:ketosteroid isomerase-like protein